MNTTELADLYSAFCPPELLKRKLEAAVKLLPEEIKTAVPSIHLGQDGLTLFSLVLITDKYLCELRVNDGQSVCEFDFAATNTIYNYRIKTWTHEIKEDEVVIASFEIAEVNLRHEGPDNLRTVLFFAGNAEGRQAWLDNLTQAIPIKVVLGFARSIG